jgi:hypothetical protein
MRNVGYALKVQEEVEEQPTEQLNVLAHGDTVDHLTWVAAWDYLQEEGELGSYNVLDYDAYCAQADVPYAGCTEEMWEERQACQLLDRIQT